MSDEVGAFSRLREGVVLCRLDAAMAMSFAGLERFVGSVGSDEQWIVFAPATALISPLLADALSAEAHRRDVEIFYGDEVERLDAAATQPTLILKPGFDITMLMASDYIGFPLIVRYATFKRLEGFRDGAETAGVYDFTLRAYADGAVVERIPKVLVAYRGQRVRAQLEDRRQVLDRWLAKYAPAFSVAEGRTGSTLRLRRRFTDYPPVTLVIPTRQSCQAATVKELDGQPHVAKLLDSLTKTRWPEDALRVIIGDAGDCDLASVDGRWPYRIDCVDMRETGHGCNHAARMNGLWRRADTEHIVLMSDDVVVKDEGWLEALLTFSMDEDVGGVGARLLFANGRIRHAGIAGGMFDALAHAWLHVSAADPTYEDWADIHREWSMVTGDVFATRTSMLEAVGGFDERFRTAFDDVDLCLRLRLLGCRIVCTPFAELVQHEEPSPGRNRLDGADCALFLRRWRELLDRDPAFHPGLDMRSFDIRPVRDDKAWYHELTTD